MVHSIPIGSKFNIYGFGSQFEKLFPQSVDYNEESLEKANLLLEKLDANLGGTEIFEPLKAIYDEESDESLPRNIFLFTDGEVSNTDSVVKLI